MKEQEERIIYNHPAIARFKNSNDAPNIPDITIHLMIDETEAREKDITRMITMKVQKAIIESATEFGKYVRLARKEERSLIDTKPYNPLRSAEYNWKGEQRETPTEKIFKTPQVIYPGKNN